MFDLAMSGTGLHFVLNTLSDHDLATVKKWFIAEMKERAARSKS